MLAAKITGPLPEAPVIRPARREDAADLARCVDLASEGLVRLVWAELAEPGEDVMAVGARRAARDEGDFSWRNATIAAVEGRVAGGLVAYRIGAPEPLDGLPPAFRPLQALENRVPGTYYVNVLATYPGFRGRGVGSRLLAEAERQSLGRGMSLIVADGNLRARRLYEAFGFREMAREAVVGEGWTSRSRDWVLMVRP